jgi:hypothetical protein
VKKGREEQTWQLVMTTQQSERIPMLMKSSSDDSLLTQLPSHHHQHQNHQKYYEMRPSSIPNGSTNGFITNNYAINGPNIVKRCLCHMMKGVQRNIQKCVAALVLISFFSIIFFTQYMDSPLVG